MYQCRNIIYFLDFPSGIGGASKVLLTQAHIMKQRGYSVKVVIPVNEKGLYAEEYDKICLDYGLEKVSLYYHVAVCMENIDIVLAMKEYKDIIKLLKINSSDLIHSSQINIAAELAARKLNIPHIMNIYQVEEQSFNINWTKIYPQYHCADSFLFCKRWEKGLGIHSECVRVAYRPKLCGEECSGLKKHDDNLNIKVVSIGILCERKNQLEIIKFILKCKKNMIKVNLSLLGSYDNEYGEKCRKFVNENGLQNDVFFKGFVLNIEDYLRNSDIFIFASKVESYPGVLVESMANKVLVITTAVAGVPELVKDGKNGFLTNGYKAEDIYRTFLRYLKYEKLGEVSKIRENAFNTYLNHHTYEIIGEQLDRYYQWVKEDYDKISNSLLSVDELCCKFKDFMCEEDIERTNPESIGQIWYLYHVISNIEKKSNKDVLIWGAGFWGSIALKWLRILKGKVRIVGFLDINKRGHYLGYPIIQEKKNAINSCGTILIALGDKKGRIDIMDYLEGLGKVRNKDYFLTCNFWSPIRL